MRISLAPEIDLSHTRCMANEIILTYTTPTLSGKTRWVYRYFKSARALARFLRTKHVVEVLSIQEAQ